mgnify:CR=1 FL=1
MRTFVLLFGIVIIMAGIMIVSYGNFRFLNVWYFPYAIPGAIVVLIGFVTCVLAYSTIPSEEGITGSELYQYLIRSNDENPSDPIRRLSSEKKYSPLFYVGGYPDYNNRTLGQMILKPDSISFITVFGSSNECSI